MKVIVDTKNLEPEVDRLLSRHPKPDEPLYDIKGIKYSMKELADAVHGKPSLKNPNLIQDFLQTAVDSVAEYFSRKT